MRSAVLVKNAATCQAALLKNFLKLFTSTKTRSLPGDIFSLNTRSAAPSLLRPEKTQRAGAPVRSNASGLSTCNALVLGTCTRYPQPCSFAAATTCGHSKRPGSFQLVALSPTASGL